MKLEHLKRQNREKSSYNEDNVMRNTTENWSWKLHFIVSNVWVERQV